MRVPPFVERLNFDRVPYALIGSGVVLSGVMVAEIVATALLPTEFTIIQIANVLTTLPFLFLLVGGGYWLLQSVLQVNRYPRIAGWTVSGFIFLTGFFIVTSFAQEGLLVRIQIVRWAAAVGSGAGVLVGIFEARAIDRAVAAKQTQLRNEELERQNDRLEEFANILSHDLRNPLQVAIGTVQILQDKYDDEYIDRVASAHDRMEQIIEETLLLAQSGQLIDEPESVSLADLVNQCWANVDTDAATLEVSSTALIVADAGRMRHLLENLFRNTVEHAGRDATIQVGTLQNGFYAEDDGPGISADDRESVLKSGYSTEEDGTGFGLAIVGAIAEAHGWSIHITEGSEGGARFEVTGVAFGEE